MTRTLVTIPDPILRKIAEPVTFDKPFDFLEDMKAIVTEHGGQGLAAPQVGVSKRVILIWDHNLKMFLFNPEFIYGKIGLAKLNEGCLSCPGRRGFTLRFKMVKLRYQDEKGEWRSLKVRDNVAFIVQHEMDHLDGKLIIDAVVTPPKLLKMKA